MRWCLFYFSILLLCFSCQTDPVDLGMATPYFPSSSQLREGFVSKYYIHRIPENKNDDITTDISYRKYRFINPDILEMKEYDAACKLTWYNKYQVDADQFRVMDSYSMIDKDTIFPKRRKNVVIDWCNNNAVLDYDLIRESYWENMATITQTGIKDTIINYKECKAIFKERKNTFVLSRNRDTTTSTTNSIQIYEKSIGLAQVFIESESYSTKQELVEQMSISEFERRANHNKIHAAYIDPHKTLDDNSDFKLCGPESRITSYYSCKERGELRRGKGRWRQILKRKLKPQLLKNESGFLTYRFVINCNEETGRFVAIGADLDYNKKEFPTETVQHFYNIISKEMDWQHCHGNYYEFDSYAYITFKLKDGEIIELLP